MKPFLLCVCFFTTLCFSAQVRGKIVDINENDTVPVPGAVVFWENTGIASTSLADGSFSLAVIASTRRLVIKAVGYNDRYATISDTSRFFLLAIKSDAALEEVEVIYYTTGTEISFLNPIKTETLNERSLMKAACCNLSESFETNPSVDVNFTDAVSGTKQIQMLGLAGQYAQITKENMPYLRGLANSYGLTFIPGTWIQSIQLSKGAGSVVNGYESFTGQVNTELQDPRTSDRLHFNTYVNNNGRNEYNLNLAQKINKHYSAGLLGHVSYNPLLQDMNMDGFADIPAGRQYNFMSKHAFEFPDKGFEAQVGGAFLDDERTGGQVKKMTADHHDSLPLYEIGIHNRKWELFSKTGYVFRKKPGTSTGLQLSYLDHSQDNFFGYTKYLSGEKTFYANYIFQGIFGNTNHGYKAGASIMNDEVKESFKGTVYNRIESVGGLFFEYAFNYKEKFNVVAGIRGDKHNYYDFFVTPRLHVRYAFTHDRVLRFSGGRALRTANVFADNASAMATSRQWIIEGVSSGMPYGLSPETGWNYGLNYTHRFKINYREAYFTLDAYRTQFTNQVVTDYENPRELRLYNLDGPSWSNTFQGEFNFEPRKRLHVKTAYRFVDTRVTYHAGTLQKPLVSKHRAFINFSYETRDKHWLFDLTTQYHGEKRLPPTTSNPQEYQREDYSPAYYNLISQVTWLTKFEKSEFHIYVGGENLLNYKQPNPIVSAGQPFSSYFDANMVWGPIYGRMVYAGLRLKFK
jgi:outer membrane receptor for ferrienterochelin and colicins